MTYKPFPPMLPSESTPVTAKEAMAINRHCEAMVIEIKRLQKALEGATNWIENRLAVEGHPAPASMSLLVGWREALEQGGEAS